MILGCMATLVSEIKGTYIELGVGETNREFPSLTFLLYLRIAEWHWDSKSHAIGTSIMKEPPFPRLLDGN